MQHLQRFATFVKDLTKTPKNYDHRPFYYRMRNVYDFRPNLCFHAKTSKQMKKALNIIGTIIYTIVAFLPILFLGYLLGLKLL